jgi:COP9 signalosome complex subunit 8
VVLDEFRERTFALIARAYTSVPLPLLQTYLGSLPVNQILSGTLCSWWSFYKLTLHQAAQQKGWSYDAANQVLTPLRPHLRGDCISF